MSRRVPVALLALLATTLLPLGAAGRASAATGCHNPFTAAFVRDLAQRYPSERVTAAVYDTRTKCWYSIHPGMRITTASVVKAQVLGAVLLRAQDRGRGLTSWEHARAYPMIRWSLNNPYVSDLYYEVGGVSGMNGLARRLGARETTNTLQYGATWTTAADRTRIALSMLYGGGPLRAAARDAAWTLMTSVHPTQRWGITAGRPTGWVVALKNGFYPMSGYGWRVGSTGFVRAPHSREGYAISVLTDHNPNERVGIRLVEAVAAQAAHVLTGAAAGDRVVTRAVCVLTYDGESWTAVARKVGQPTSAWTNVRLVSGGNPSPLQGQRACSPDLRPKP